MNISEKLNAVHKLIVIKHREMFDESPSPMKLQKLCYYAQGFMLAQGVELFPEDFQAWQHGPVIPELYQVYRDYQWRAIDLKIDTVEMDESVSQELVDIVSAYGRYDGAALSTMTHREAPWLDARGNIPESCGSNAVISKEALRGFFKAQLS